FGSQASRTLLTTSARKRTRFVIGPTVEIGALVRSAPQELVDEVTVGGVDLNSVKTRLARIRCRGPIVRQRLGDAGEGQRNRRGTLGWQSRNESLAVGPNRRRGDRRNISRKQRAVRYPANVPQLEEDMAPLGMNGIDNLSPPADLLWRVNSWGVDVALAHG